MHRIKLHTILILTSTLFFTTAVYSENKHSEKNIATISISEAWISEAPPMVSVLAGYAKIKNTSDQSLTLISVSSPDFSNVELHLSKIINNIATMEKQESLNIAANESVEFLPGDYHLMLFDPKASMKAGDSAKINFRFTDGIAISVTATVKKRSTNTHHHDHH